MHLVLFLIFGAMAVAGAVNLLLQRAPINSALSLVAVMGALAVLYLLLGAEFIAFIQVLVYAGAIMVLFVFVIMLLNAQPAERGRTSRIARIFGLPVLVLLIIEMAGLMYGQFPASEYQVRLGEYMIHVEDVGTALFREYLLPFEVTSVLFLIGVVGAVVLAGRREVPEREAGLTRPAAVTAATHEPSEVVTSR